MITYIPTLHIEPEHIYGNQKREMQTVSVKNVFKVPTNSMKTEGSFVHTDQNCNPSYAYFVSRHLHRDKEQLILGTYILQAEGKSDYLVLVFIILIHSI